MVAKTDFSKEDIDQILSNYNLGEYKESKPITKGAVQTNYLLHTSKGKYVLRYYENRSRESVLFESDLISYLNDKNYPCPTPIKNKQGDIVGMYKAKPCIIFEFVEGDHAENPTEDQKKQLIGMVALLQNVTSDYKPRYVEHRWNYSIELCKELARKETEKLNTSNAEGKLKWYEDELSKIQLPETLPKGICHCDFHFRMFSSRWQNSMLYLTLMTRITLILPMI